jgi:hypothetical protein
VWERRLGGSELRFHLAGINNENFIMQDEGTGSWWQQVTGRAFLGPRRGSALPRVPHDEVSFARWKEEHPTTRVLRPESTAVARYASANWEEKMRDYPVVTPRREGEPFEDRDLIVGVEAGRVSKAYLLSDLAKGGPVNDRLGDLPILLVTFEEGRSVRAFDRTLPEGAGEFYWEAGEKPASLIDSRTGSRWDLRGVAMSGPLAGQKLRRIEPLLDFWFDWKTYHPDTEAYKAGR